MQLSQLYGFVLAILMGFTLGLFGGGGSILAVPIFVYVFHIEPLLATAYSLWVVKKHLDQQIEYKVGLLFVVPSALTVFLTRRFLLPQIPLQLFTFGNVILTKNMAIMLFFSTVMLLAAYSMIRGISMHHSGTEPDKMKTVISGAVVGLVTSLVGAGGGFLIVPALVILLGLNMSQAVGTSLAIIALNSMSGFMGDIIGGRLMDWSFLLTFSVFALIGMMLGLYSSKKIEVGILKKYFGFFVLAMAILIIIKELLS
jgi:uncharacterized membrane protein YfcA